MICGFFVLFWTNDFVLKNLTYAKQNMFYGVHLIMQTSNLYSENTAIKSIRMTIAWEQYACIIPVNSIRLFILFYAHEKTSLTAFTYSDVICLHSYDIYKNSNFIIFWYFIVARIMYYDYTCMKQYFNILGLFQLSDTKFCPYLKM